MKKALVLPKYSRRAASTRYRIEQFLPSLDKTISVDIVPLLDDDYLLHNKNKFFESLSVFDSYINRLKFLQRANEYDFIWVNYEMFPYIPSFFESKFYFKNKVWLDFDDAIFHQYNDHKNFLIRSVLASKIKNIIARAAVVTVGNEYLASYAKKYSNNVVYVPTVVDCEKYIPNPTVKNKVRIGWIGSPSTTKYLKAIESVLSKVQEQKDIEIVLIGASNLDLSFSSTRIDWEEESEISEVQKFDIGIMPLLNSSWEEGKCGFKLIQYMACGIPVIASPVGVNKKIVGDLGFLPQNDEAWYSALIKLIDNKELRSELGSKARNFILNNYSLKKWANEFKNIASAI
ncbi:MAG: glycosyltransferase family 4 protein [Oligoflexia bacterium]|nr:glycosyltransferase family 4 protein [Oligoflexia bacterium]